MLPTELQSLSPWLCWAHGLGLTNILPSSPGFFVSQSWGRAARSTSPTQDKDMMGTQGQLGVVELLGHHEGHTDI